MVEEQESVSSVRKAMRILREFSQDEPELGITQLSSRLGMPKSTVCRLIQILCEENMVQKNKQTRKYHLSLAAFEIGSVVYHEMELCQIALPLLKKMLPAVQGAIQMVAYDKGGVVYLFKLPEDRDTKILNTMGKRVPAHCTASGKMMLAHQDEAEIARVLQTELKAYTRETIIDPEQLRTELIKIKESGFAVSHGEFNGDMSSVAIPVYDDMSYALAAICVIRPSVYLSSAQVQLLVKEMKIYSRLINEQLGMMKMKKRRHLRHL
jgi:IclR family KDG regulon transcriptional repressor